MKALFAAGLVALLPLQADRVVPVHEEPRHRLVFATPGTRILDIQIPPQDTTLFHTHSDPILYVTMSTSRTRSQNLGTDWSAPAEAPSASGAPSAPSVPTAPPGRVMSVTSYFGKPLTHRVNNIGTSLFRLIGITNESAGDETTTPSTGFNQTPELTNRWFRAYRWALATEPTLVHRHANAVVIVDVAGSAAVRFLKGEPRQLRQPGEFAFVAADAAHTMVASSPDTQVMEVEIRTPR
jgi:hypothetical protein